PRERRSFSTKPNIVAVDRHRELQLVAFNLYVHIANIMRNSGRQTPWSDAVRWSKEGTSCYPALVDSRGCIFHGCQTSRAASGGGLTQRGKVVGHLLWQVGTNASCKPPDGLLGNYGFIPPKNLSEGGSWLLKRIEGTGTWW